MRLLFTIWLLAGLAAGYAQAPAFRNITISDGLNEGVVESLGQDKYGYIWIGTASGINRYDGIRVRQYLHRSGDTTSPYPDNVWGAACGPDSNMYFGFAAGLVRYNYTRDNFTRLRSPRPFGTGSMISKDGQLLLATSVGLVVYDTRKEAFSFFSDLVTDTAQLKLANRGLGDMELLPDGRIAATSRIGLLVFDLKNRSIQQVTVPRLGTQFFSNVEIAGDGTVWMSAINQPVLVRTDTSFRQFRIRQYVFPNRNVVGNAVSSLLIDGSNQLWVTTIPDGLCLYDQQADSFVRYINHPFQPASLNANHLTAIFQDRQGLIWLGTGGYGVNYFHPHKKMFQTLLPRGQEQTAGGWMWGRSSSQDARGHLWLATLSGVVEYSLKDGVVRSIRNEEDREPRIYSNSVRGVQCEGDTVWIITGGGVNRYHRATGKMDFLDLKDSLPPAFYFTVFRDRTNTIWIGGRDNEGFYYREPGRGFRSVRSHPVLHPLAGYGVRSLFEDRRGRLWIGLNGSGLALYDPAGRRVRRWVWKEGDPGALVGDLVTGIGEDNQGLIWVSTNSGIAAYDEKKDRFVQYTRATGLPAVRTSCLRVDGANRVWAGSTQGLLMLDVPRKAWTVFGRNDGLPDAEFADMPSGTLQDGRFIFPTLKGFVLFDPARFQPVESPLSFFVSAFHVLNRDKAASTDLFPQRELRLSHDQNFFSIELTALNYDDPEQTWYAYKLEGFDKDWTYTRDRNITYTNVPGGTYRFLYKASSHQGSWEGPARELSIRVGTVYYKTLWFWCLVAGVSFYSGFSLYRFRMGKQRQILRLETIARELEREKTVVQYESLKQHLNPHFLFNSLTSLRSLIKTDPKTATGFLDGLSKVYRYVLKSREQELTPVREELAFVQTFISLQKTRFGKGLEATVEVGEEYLEKKVVPVTLQNLVENAIKHNTADAESPLRIHISVKDDYLNVENNLQRYSIVETSNGQGLQQLKNLYDFYTSKPILILEDEQRFTVKIPLL